jgi:hypothetical protein
MNGFFQSDMPMCLKGNLKYVELFAKNEQLWAHGPLFGKEKQASKSCLRQWVVAASWRSQNLGPG